MDQQSFNQDLLPFLQRSTSNPNPPFFDDTIPAGDTRLYEKIKSLGYKIFQVGDCLEPRNAKDAIYESAVLGRRI